MIIFPFVNILKVIVHLLFNYEDKAICKKVLDFFKLHLYLPDLRKENFHLEYEFSTTHQYICYDLIERRLINLHRFKKHITKEYLLESMKNPDTKIEIIILVLPNVNDSKSALSVFPFE